MSLLPRKNLTIRNHHRSRAHQVICNPRNLLRLSPLLSIISKNRAHKHSIAATRLPYHPNHLSSMCASTAHPRTWQTVTVATSSGSAWWLQSLIKPITRRQRRSRRMAHMRQQVEMLASSPTAQAVCSCLIKLITGCSQLSPLMFP